MPHVVASDGAEIAFDDVGTGRPLLLVHGWATHAGFFAPQVEGLSQDFRVIAVDLRGHGRSRAGDTELSIDTLAADITDLIRQLDLRDLLVVGWSMGAMVLWRALLDGDVAERVAGMVVIDMTPRVQNGGDWHHGLRGGNPTKSMAQTLDIMVANWPAVGPRVANRIFAAGREVEQAILRRWAADEITHADPVAMADLWASLTAQDFRDDLGGLEMPVLITHGRLSRLYSDSTAQALAGLLAHAVTVGFDQSGHAPHLEEPARFNRTLTEFAATLRQQGGGDTPTARTDQSSGI